MISESTRLPLQIMTPRCSGSPVRGDRVVGWWLWDGSDGGGERVDVGGGCGDGDLVVW